MSWHPDSWRTDGDALSRQRHLRDRWQTSPEVCSKNTRWIPPSLMTGGAYPELCAVFQASKLQGQCEEHTFRTITSLNKADGSITLQTEVQEGTSASGSRSEIQSKTITGLDLMADRIKQELGGDQPKLVFHLTARREERRCSSIRRGLGS